MYKAHLLVPSGYKLPNEWHISHDGYVVPPMPEGEDLRDVINYQWLLQPHIQPGSPG